MAPARKRQRVKEVESVLSASGGHENRSSGHVPPVSIMKDIIASFPRTDETEEMNLRRKTYFIHGADTFEEDEPCIIPDAQVETSNPVDDKIRRLTYVVTPCNAESPLMNYNPGKEMTHSEMVITGTELQPSSLQDSKPKKRVGKKKSIQALQEDPKVMESENADHKKENESLISNAPAGGKPRKRDQKKSASSKDAQVKSQESEENGTEISNVKAKGRRKKAQAQENESIPTGSNVLKKAVKRGKKKNAY